MDLSQQYDQPLLVHVDICWATATVLLYRKRGYTHTCKPVSPLVAYLHLTHRIDEAADLRRRHLDPYAPHRAWLGLPLLPGSCAPPSQLYYTRCRMRWRCNMMEAPPVFSSRQRQGATTAPSS